MAKKDATDRIDETLAYLQTTTVVAPAERNPAYNFASNFIATNFPAGNAGQLPYEAFSRGMSLGWHVGKDPNELRKMKRATYLLSKAIASAPASNGQFVAYVPGNIGDSQARTTFIDTIRKARIVYEGIAGGNGGSTHVLNLVLSANPLQFLATNKLIVKGSPVRDPNTAPLNVRQFNFVYDPMKDRYQFSAGAGSPNACPVMVDSVTAGFWTDVAGSWGAVHPHHDSFAAIQAIRLSQQFAVTTQFTGCSFCMKRHLGNVYCAHLTPTRGPTAQAARGGVTGNVLAREVAGRNPNVTAGEFANAAGGNPISIYGPGYSRGLANNATHGYPDGMQGGDSYMTIVAIQNGLDYHIYSQVTLNMRISSFQRIF